jgi:hypothetical protein
MHRPYGLWLFFYNELILKGLARMHRCLEDLR